MCVCGFFFFLSFFFNESAAYHKVCSYVMSIFEGGYSTFILVWGLKERAGTKIRGLQNCLFVCLFVFFKKNKGLNN